MERAQNSSKWERRRKMAEGREEINESLEPLRECGLEVEGGKKEIEEEKRKRFRPALV